MALINQKIKLIFLAILIGAAAIFFAASVAKTQENAAGPSDIQFPVEELGGCKSENDCKSYCDKPQNIEACVDFAEKHNLLSDEELERGKKFAEIEKFLDTPVKYYSSGMYVRPAFSVASHMEPDVLLVDEVLAVGDTEFQKKCLGKMDEITKKEGRTILFVSHNLNAIRQLCTRVVLLESGKIKRCCHCYHLSFDGIGELLNPVFMKYSVRICR